MTRQVFPNAQVAHVWAQQSQEEGRSNNGNFWFRGDTIYSYGRHFPIARFYTMPDGSRAVLFTTRGYSVTTNGKHIPAVRRALNYGRDIPIHDVYDPSAEPLRNWQDEREQADRALKYAGETKHGGARKKRLADYRAAVDTANRLHQVFGVGELLTIADDITAEMDKMHAAEMAKRAEAERKEAERKAEMLAAWPEMLAAWPEMLAQWRAGLNPLTYDFGFSFHQVSRIAPIALRVKPGEHETIQTTWGVEFPTAEAIKAFAFVKLCHDTQSEVKVPRTGPKLGHFNIDAVTAEGDVKAGCHLVPWASIAACAADLGLAV